MAISFIGSGISTNDNTNLNVTAASFFNTSNSALSTSDFAAGDIVLVVIGRGQIGTGAIGTPTGFTAIGSQSNGDDSDDCATRAFYKYVFDTSSDLTFTVNASGSATNGNIVAFYALRGVDPTTALDVTPVNTTGTNTSVPNAGAITPTTSGAWVMAIGVGGLNAAITAFTNPSGMSGTTNHFRASTGSAATQKVALGVALYTAWSSGAYDPAVFGGGTVDNRASWAATSIALRPLTTVTLNALTWRRRTTTGSQNYGYVAEGSLSGSFVGNVGSLTGPTTAVRTAGATLTIGVTNDGGGRFAIDTATGNVTVTGTPTFNYETEPTISLDIVETHASATNSPRTTTLTIRTKDIFESGAQTVSWDVDDRCVTNGASSWPNVSGLTLTGTSGVNAFQGIRTDVGYIASSGSKIYYEVTVGTIIAGNGFRVGFAEMSHTNLVAGNNPGGNTATGNGFAWTGGTNFHANGSVSGTVTGGSAAIAGDILMVACDIATGKIWVGKNGTWHNSGNPTAGTGQVVTLTGMDDYFAFAACANNDSLTYNFGASAFTYTVPTGFQSYDTGYSSGGGGSTARVTSFWF